MLSHANPILVKHYLATLLNALEEKRKTRRRRNVIVALAIIVLSLAGFWFGLQYRRSQQAQTNLWDGATQIQQTYSGKDSRVTFIRAFSTPGTSTCFEFSQDFQEGSRRYTRAIFIDGELQIFDTPAQQTEWSNRCRIWSENFLDALQKGGR